MKLLLISFLSFLTFHANSQTVPSYVDTAGLMAWYPFTGNALDSSMHGHNGIVVGATLTSDRFGNANSAYQFNGSSSKITTNFIPPTNNGARTISCWFKYDSLPHPCGDFGLCLLGYGGDNRGCGESAKNFSLELDYTGHPTQAGVDGICVATRATSLADTMDSNWHFFAAVYDSAFGDFYNIKLYLDGQFDSTSTLVYGYTTQVQTDTLSKLQIGAGHYDCPRYFAGKIDDIGIWKRALDTSELHVLYRTTRSGSTGIKAVSQSFLTVYPNPATTSLTITPGENITTVAITNLLGQTICTHEYNTDKVEIDVAGLPTGMYLIRINDSEVRRFVKD